MDVFKCSLECLFQVYSLIQKIGVAFDKGILKNKMNFMY